MAVSFITFFKDTNIIISSSGKKINAIMESKSFLDTISSRIKTDKTSDINKIVNHVLKDNYIDDFIIFTTEDDIYTYNKKRIHLLIKDEVIIIKSKSYNATKIKIILFYKNGKRQVGLSNYILNGVD